MLARVLGPQDAKRYIDLRVRASREEPAALTFEVERELAQVADTGPASIFSEDQPRIHWGVEHHRALVGVLAASRRFNVIMQSHVWLWGLYVRPRYRGTGASRALMDTVIRWSESESWQDRLLSSYPADNARAKRLLERWKFLPLPESESRHRVPGVLPGYEIVERLRFGASRRPL